MDREFDIACKRLSEENNKRKLEAKQKLLEQRRIRQEQKKLEAIYQEQQEQFKIQQEIARQLNEKDQLNNSTKFIYKQNLKFTLKEEEGDRMILPQSALEKISTELGNLNSILHFKISRISQNGEKKISTCGGVLEFTAAEGTVALPKKIARKLNLINTSDVDQVEIKYLSLPKARFALLKPQNPSLFNEIPDLKAHLQAFLPVKYCSLTEGDSVEINFSGKTHLVDVVSLKPSKSVSIIDTEMEVEIEMPFIAKAEEENIEIIKTDKEIKSSLQVNHWRYFKLFLTENQLENVKSHKENLEFHLKITNYYVTGGDTKLYLSFSNCPTAFDYFKVSEFTAGNLFILNLSKHDFSNHPEIFASLKSENGIFIGIHANFATIEFEFQAKTKKVEENDDVKRENNPIEEKNNVSTVLVDENFVFCSNCQKQIPKQGENMHFSFCHRNNVRCEICGKILLKNQMQYHKHCPAAPDCSFVADSSETVDKHFSIFHSKKKCELCSKEYNSLMQLREHQEKYCFFRKIKCRFCGDIVLSEGEPDDFRDTYYWGLSKHEGICGSKTVNCNFCNKSIRMKELDIHLQIHK